MFDGLEKKNKPFPHVNLMPPFPPSISAKTCLTRSSRINLGCAGLSFGVCVLQTHLCLHRCGRSVLESKV